MSGRSGPILALALALACAGPYAERPPASGTTSGAASGRGRSDPGAAPAGTPAASGGPGGATVIGHVTPDGRLHADTVAQAPAPDPVDRETVVTGTIRAADATAPARETEALALREEHPAAPVWRIQVFAARDEATADEVARRSGGAVPGVPVYVEAEGAWFKVRLGDFATREAAEPLRERLVGLGWTEAWAVRTRVPAP